MASQIQYIIILLFEFLNLVLLARVILSWIPMNPGDALSSVAQVVYEITEPMCAPFRALIPPIGGLDFSIILVFLALSFFRQTIFGMLG